jgi:pimeloyl-ACP methyl ester carboxylesterase
MQSVSFARLRLILSLLVALVVTVDARAQVPPTGGIVFVANGAGDSQATSDTLSRVIAECGLPLRVEVVRWSHGSGRYLRDHFDHCNHRAAGERLAATVAAYRQQCPGLKVYLVGGSTGSSVVLAAAEALPPGCVDRIVLLAPSVSPCYDLRRALASSACGIDVFTSNRDFLVLGLGTRLLGTADGYHGPAAGKVGFRPVVCCPADAALYANLREHPWERCQRQLGHLGGHYGTNRPEFQRAFVLPLLGQPIVAMPPGLP